MRRCSGSGSVEGSVALELKWMKRRENRIVSGGAFTGRAIIFCWRQVASAEPAGEAARGTRVSTALRTQAWPSEERFSPEMSYLPPSGVTVAFTTTRVLFASPREVGATRHSMI